MNPTAQAFARRRMRQQETGPIFLDPEKQRLLFEVESISHLDEWIKREFYYSVGC